MKSLVIIFFILGSLILNDSQFYKIPEIGYPIQLNCKQNSIIKLGNDTILRVVIDCNKEQLDVKKTYIDSLLYHQQYYIEDSLYIYNKYTMNPTTLTIDTTIIYYHKVREGLYPASDLE